MTTLVAGVIPLFTAVVPVAELVIVASGSTPLYLLLNVDQINGCWMLVKTRTDSALNFLVIDTGNV